MFWLATMAINAKVKTESKEKKRKREKDEREIEMGECAPEKGH